MPSSPHSIRVATGELFFAGVARVATIGATTDGAYCARIYKVPK